MIDGKEFDETRIDQFVNLGDTEEWTVEPYPNFFLPLFMSNSYM